jgi:hypothetical protein
MGQEGSQITVVKSINMAVGLLLIDTDVLIDYSRGIEKNERISEKS